MFEVGTVPFPLRFPLAFDGKLLGQVVRIFTDTVPLATGRSSGSSTMRMALRMVAGPVVSRNSSRGFLHEIARICSLEWEV
jgi:hypothetical protein